jgi:ABC-type sugar transport system ATPase subunit
MQQPQNATRGQLERRLSQQFQKLYRDKLGHLTGKVSCRLFDNKLTIVIEDSLTQPEQLLLKNGSSQRVAYLSGGNQQKVLLSKCLASQPEVLFAVDPTRGIDVGSKAEIHRILNEIAEKGVGIILISSEIDEVIALSDRIIILNDGRIEETVERQNFSGQKIRVTMQK